MKLKSISGVVLKLLLKMKPEKKKKKKKKEEFVQIMQTINRPSLFVKQ